MSLSLAQPGDRLTRAAGATSFVVAACLVLTLLLLLAAPATGQELCVPPDGNSCVEDAVGGAQDPIEDATDEVADTVEATVDDALGAIGDVLPPEVPGPPGGGGGGGPAGGAADPRRPSASPASSGTAAVGSGSTADLALEGAIGRAVGSRPRTSLADVLRASLDVATRSLVVVAALLGVAAAFVMVQDRLDRADPKLALAPVESDIVMFT